jgi:hypothetical protein
MNMERAARIHQYGAPEVLAVEPVEVTAPGPGEVRIRHTAIGLNFVEVYFRRGTFTTPVGFKNGLRRLARSGEMSSTSRPMRRPRSKSALITSASRGRRAIFRLPECTQSRGWPVSSVNASILRQASLVKFQQRYEKRHGESTSIAVAKIRAAGLSPMHSTENHRTPACALGPWIAVLRFARRCVAGTSRVPTLPAS